MNNESNESDYHNLTQLQRRARLRRQSGQSLVVLLGCLVAALAVGGLAGGGDTAYSGPLLIALIVSVAVSRSAWRRRFLPLYIATGLVAVAALAALSGTALLRPSMADIVIVTLGAWVLQTVIARAESKAGPEINLVRSVDWPAIAAPDDLGKALFTELLRSRRHGRPFTLAILRFDRPIASLALERFRELNEIISRVLRFSDAAYMGAHDDELVIVCPETGPEGAMQPLVRLLRAIAEARFDDVQVGCATFPQDGLAGEDLLAVARARLATDLIEQNVVPVVDGTTDAPARLARTS